MLLQWVRMAGNHENDLPLTANTKDILIYHYILDLECDVKAKRLGGRILMFLDAEKGISENKKSKEASNVEPSCQVFSIQEFQSPIREHVHPNKVNNPQPTGSANQGETDKNADAQKHNICAEPSILNTHAEGHVAMQSCDSDSQAGSGENIPLNINKNDRDFIFTLDCHKLDISFASEVILDHSLSSLIRENKRKPLNQCKELYLRCLGCPYKALDFDFDEWSLRIRKNGVRSADDIPPVISVSYRVRPDGSSLRWATDQDGKPCVYSAAMWINNRALFPCQEYGSLSTWQARVITEDSAVQVLMSADHDAVITDLPTGRKSWYYECSAPMPSFTMALAIGYWDQGLLGTTIPESIPVHPPEVTCQHIPPCEVPYSTKWVVPSRVFAPASILPKAMKTLSTYIPKCCVAIQKLLGAHPFPRLDIVIYPACSQDMALANPSLLFLSQSMLTCDDSMTIKVAHEMSHAWFGLFIGARDWTEEWLSEGFATFIEDHVHAGAMEWSEEEAEERAELRALIRLQVLEGELANSQSELQVLRPNHGAEVEVPEGEVMYVKNGMNANKLFSQVHYLKGYFLLRHLCVVAGKADFLTGMKNYIIQFHGRMVHSREFLQFIFNACPVLGASGWTVDKVYEEWLDCSGLPKALSEAKLCFQNKRYSQVKKELETWKNLIKNRSRKRKRKGAMQVPDFNRDLESDELVLLFEELLQVEHIPNSVLKLLRSSYSLTSPDVRHRWCELVVKHKYKAGYFDVSSFLTNDQAMGVYLYGELIISGCKDAKTVAETCFTQNASEMEEGTRNMVHTMLYGEKMSD